MYIKRILTPMLLALLLCLTPTPIAASPAEASCASFAPVFDADYYLARYADVREACGGSRTKALEHFVTVGMREMRVASPHFDVRFYAANYPFLFARYGTDWERYYLPYIRTGLREGRIADRPVRILPKTNEALSTEPFLREIKTLVDKARRDKYTYGNSQSPVPCDDHVMSCDRLVSRVLWDFGYTDQPAGGCVISNEPDNIQNLLLAAGFKKSIGFKNIRRGSVVIVMTESGNRHMFVVLDFDMKTRTFTKYDEGAQWRIDAEQPFVEEWAYPGLVGVYNLPK